MGVFKVQMAFFRANRCVGVEKVVRYIGVFGEQMGCFEVFGGERGVWGRKRVSMT